MGRPRAVAEAFRSKPGRGARHARRCVPGGVALLRWLSATVCAASLALHSGWASAHHVWLEPTATGVKLYFGEFADNQREVSPGYLDKLSDPVARRVTGDAEEVLPRERRADAIHFRGRTGRGGAIVAADESYPPRPGAQDGGEPRRTAWTPAARFASELSAQPAKLALDVVPSGQPGEFVVTYRGAPLGGAEAMLIAMSGWSRRGRTNVEGRVKFNLPWKGVYALLVRHEDPTPGTRKSNTGVDEAYDVATFATTLTFVTSSGLPSPPRPPLAPPNPVR